MKRLAALLPLVLAATSWANARIDSLACHIRDHALSLDIRASLILPDDPVTAVKSGLTLALVYDIRLRQSRPWRPGHRTLEYRQHLSYNPLSQQYILETPTQRLSFAYLGDALARATHVRNLPVAATLEPNRDYHADIRLRLDKAQLPVSLQLDALVNRAWHIESEWHPCPPVR
ncbi:MAG: DUF4390 domain-containing protein [Cardiobacteriaceae bacterium]|nr:DUF4390 domain-containing protein [Cardiobacteriaceae bacterium]